MHPADIKKTVIITPFGLFEFLCQPFGVRNSGNTFQRQMDRVTSELANAFTYLDNLMIFGRSLEDHELHLFQVLSRLQEHRLVINLEKCVFGAISVDFLGHRVSVDRDRPLLAHMETVEKFPESTSIREMQAFLCLISFYRRFLPAIAHILWPLTDSLQGSKRGTEVVL